jgi:uncharacterized protein YodC (DUF2158 family)
MSLGKQESVQFERRAIVAALSWLCDPLRTMENFQKGDTVQLKSGGPIMTVGGSALGGELICDWFDGKENKSAGFYAEQLTKAEPPGNQGGGYEVRQR